MTQAWAHDALAADLMDARHLCGEIAIERLGVRGGVLDVASVRLSWSHPDPTGYECKVSRGDFLADVRAGKYRHYLPDVERLFFCVPRGLVDLGEVPPECGVMLRGANGWHVARRAPRRPLEPLAHARLVTALLFRHYPAPWDGAERAARNVRDRVVGPCARCGHAKADHVYHVCWGGDVAGGCECRGFEAGASLR